MSDARVIQLHGDEPGRRRGREQPAERQRGADRDEAREPERGVPPIPLPGASSAADSRARGRGRRQGAETPGAAAAGTASQPQPGARGGARAGARGGTRADTPAGAGAGAGPAGGGRRNPSTGGRRAASGGRTGTAPAVPLSDRTAPGAAEALSGRQRPDWERAAAGALAFLRRRITGEYEVDDFGFDPDLAEHLLAAPFRPLYSRWFRVEAQGLPNVPDSGGALLVANHSGTLPLDAVMTTLALLDHHPAHRHLRLLGADLVFQLPVVGEVSRKAGHTLACAPDAERLLRTGELVGVWPEGFKGLGKPFSERYKLQRFGRGGFVSTALRVGVPIIPCSIVGAEEIYPMIGNARTLARLLGFPYFPLTPTFPWLGPLGMVPLPSKWLIEFGEPIDTSGFGASAADDPMLVFNLTDQVRETIQQTLYRLLLQRRSVFR